MVIRKVVDYAKSKEGKKVGRAALQFVRESGLGKKAVDTIYSKVSKKLKSTPANAAAHAVHNIASGFLSKKKKAPTLSSIEHHNNKVLANIKKSKAFYNTRPSHDPVPQNVQQQARGAIHRMKESLHPISRVKAHQVKTQVMPPKTQGEAPPGRHQSKLVTYQGSPYMI